MRPHSWRRRSPVWPATPAASPTRPAELLIRDLADYVARLDPELGAERSWLTDQLEALGWPRWRISVAISLAIANGQARAELVDGVHVIVPTAGGRSR